MYFKRLEIFGFKSFADKTVLNFEPGITAVIGPNGCGKSNIFDAIRWVLGEQSIKELRGASSEDVIFNGTDKKPALGFAEVSVTFSNESRALNIDYDEVMITRRLFRSGESEYLINKSTVRLKDITELLMGTGIGAEAYSLVQQGRVDLVVSAKPEDRRMILDEASGITKYKSKKKEALSKLKDTEQNLVRLNDIVVEVKRQIASIERQANKARKYKTEFERLKSLEVYGAGLDLGTCETQRQELRDLLADMQEREAALAAEIRDYEERLAQDEALIEELEGKINALNADDIKLDGQIDINNRQIGFNEERLANIDGEERRIAASQQQLRDHIRQEQARQAEIQAVLDSLDHSTARTREVLAESRKRLEDLSAEVQAAESAIQQAEETVLAITSSQVGLKNHLTEVMKESQGALARQRRLELEQGKVRREKQEVDDRLNGLSVNLEDCRRQVTADEARLGEEKFRLGEQRAQHDVLDADIDELERRKLFLISQKDFIEKLAVQYDDIPDPVIEGRLFTQQPPEPHHSGIIGKMRSMSKVEGEPRSVVSGNFASPDEPLYEIFCETKFIELDPQQISAKIVELSGQIDEKTAAREEIKRQIEAQEETVRAVDAGLQELHKRLSVFQAQQEDVAKDAVKLVDELKTLAAEIAEASKTVEEMQQAEAALAQRLDSSNDELRNTQEDIRDKQQAISAMARQREELSVTVAQMETEIASTDDKKQGHLDNIRLTAESVARDEADIVRLEDGKASLIQKREQFHGEIDGLNRTIDELRRQKDSIRGVLGAHQREREELVARSGADRTGLAARRRELDDIKGRLHRQELTSQDIGYREKEIKDRLWQTYKIDYAALQAARAEDATAAAAPESTAAGEPVSPQPDEGTVAAESPAEEAVAGETEPAPEPAVVVSIPDPDFSGDRDALQAEIERLRKRCDAFGSVNLVAIEEFEELRERFEFLTRQQSDLISARESLLQTIRKINRQTRQMFMDTFTRVGEEFRIYFRMLFGGGDAQLILQDPENVLESGIEIIARPPGKKLQNISLMSGGEKSLTAIALIFGVFKVNPSPFCVLDEIDAALDEVNVGRYAYLLQDFAKIAQFIVITHNKKTISSANVMYGITMQQTGVSKVVSVKFDRDGAAGDAAEPEAVAVGA